MPTPVFAVYSDLTQDQAVSYYLLYMLLGTAIFLLIAGCLFAYWKYLVEKDNRKSIKRRKVSKIVAETKINEKEILQGVLVIIGIGLLLRIVAAFPSPGYANDLSCWRGWSQTAADHFLDTYNLDSVIDYPPGYVYILAVCGFIKNLFGVENIIIQNFIVRLPAIFADCAIGFFIYKLLKGRTSKNWTYFFVAFWIFNPLAIIDSTVWGQVDSVLTLALVIALYLITKEKYVLSAVAFGVGIMLKPQAIIVLPVLGYAVIKNKKIKTIIFSALAGIGSAVAVALPFALNADLTVPHVQEKVQPILDGILNFFGASGNEVVTAIVQPFAWILSLFMGTAGHYSYASVNALNFFFALDGNWVDDSGPLMGLTWFTWGMIFIVISAALVWFLYIKTKKSQTLPFIAASVLLMLVANFGPRMHERYFFPAVVLLMIAAVLRNNKYLFGLATITSVLGFFTVLEVLVDLNLGVPYMWLLRNDWPDFINVFRWLLSKANVGAAIATATFAIADSFGKIEKSKFDKKIWR